jgi:hypothetical protein
MNVTFMLALYGGPDQLMPITSGLTAVFAFLLIFWNKVLVVLDKALNLFHRSPESPSMSGAEPPTKDPQETIDGPRSEIN